MEGVIQGDRVAPPHQYNTRGAILLRNQPLSDAIERLRAALNVPHPNSYTVSRILILLSQLFSPPNGNNPQYSIQFLRELSYAELLLDTLLHSKRNSYRDDYWAVVRQDAESLLELVRFQYISASPDWANDPLRLTWNEVMARDESDSDNVPDQPAARNERREARSLRHRATCQYIDFLRYLDSRSMLEVHHAFVNDLDSRHMEGRAPYRPLREFHLPDMEFVTGSREPQRHWMRDDPDSFSESSGSDSQNPPDPFELYGEGRDEGSHASSEVPPLEFQNPHPLAPDVWDEIEEGGQVDDMVDDMVDDGDGDNDGEDNSNRRIVREETRRASMLHGRRPHEDEGDDGSFGEDL